MATLARPVSGPFLRMLRRRADLSQAALAQQMGVRRQRVDYLEGLAAVPERAAERFLEALEAALAESKPA
jgi:DNA-binding transcriptional regulator YiaG